ncbi:hypothetical protein ACFMPD_14220 [Sedimentitalea sp. HM32M-2]|uniref:hypothetical protein n=1 Tax=Sedimentitalea sp. HM32M-2 TaxID=3351566 RepID=UPI00362AF996
MGLSYHLFQTRRLIYVRLTGPVGLADIFRLYSVLERDKAFRPGSAELIDFAGLSDLDLSYNDMRTLRLRERDYYTRTPNPVLCVIHAPSDTNFGMARMYQQLVATTGDHVVEIARDEAEALAMLNQPEASFSSLLADPECAPEQPAPNLGLTST